jgi:hypothetical protein
MEEIPLTARYYQAPLPPNQGKEKFGIQEHKGRM